jgi:UDP-GlcNAc:undecaprenyl-phosphate/decaprenyl-phosphate GlcNAc-1-phosphate transferase
MVWICLSLIAVSAAMSAAITWALVRVGHRLRTYDSPGVAGQVKADLRRVPNTGGVAIFLAVTVPIVIGVLAVGVFPDRLVQAAPAIAEHLPGLGSKTPTALALVAALLVVHVMGLIDDRRALGAGLKMLVMLVVAAALSISTESRLLTLLDAHVGGAWLSYIVTVLWLVAVTNSMNFLDNMDGLSGGIGIIAASFFLAGTLVGPNPQWFVGACLALLVGALAGFLVFNAPRPWSDRSASIFMGDGGSLVLGLLLGFLTVRTTFIEQTPATLGPGSTDGSVASGGSVGLYAVFIPVVVLAVPLYDFTTVLLLRLRQGRNPFVGDLQHVSHRLVQRGLSRRGAVYVIWAFTAATCCGSVTLRSLEGWQAAIVGTQTILILAVLWSLEHASRRSAAGEARGRGSP